MNPSTDSAVLVLRLAGPLQSWGESSGFNRRDTRPEPTKSGIVGMLAAALGRAREADISDLAALTLGVRTDQPGSVARDYHTASDYRGDALKQAGANKQGNQRTTSPAKHTHITTRYYLQDAAFLAGLEGSAELVGRLARAIRRPAFPLALGRRSCPPTQPICLGGQSSSLLEVLETQPWIASERARDEFKRRSRHTPAFVDLPVTIDDENGTDIRHDTPLTYDARSRRFTERRVRHLTMRIPTEFTEPEHAGPETPDTDHASHDPFALLGW